MTQRPSSRRSSDRWFHAGLWAIGAIYLLLVLAMMAADASFTTSRVILAALRTPEIRYSIKLSMITCTITAILCLWVAVPLGYLLSRAHFPGRGLIDAILDIPIVLPPLVIGLSLLILFQVHIGGKSIEARLNDMLHLSVTYAVPSVVLAQFAVACAFAVRTMRVTFDQINPRNEQVARTLGCTRGQAFWRVTLPEAKRGMFTAATLAWARSLGEFGPILIFSGATRMKTEVLSTSVFLELSIGNIEAAVAVSLVMVTAAIIVLLLVRLLGGSATMDQSVGRPPP